VVEIVMFVTTATFYSFPQIWFKCMAKNDLELYMIDPEIVDEVSEKMTEEKKRRLEAQKKTKAAAEEAFEAAHIN
jgi:hypothetical protein